MHKLIAVTPLMRVFNCSGIYVPTPGALYVVVEIVGGGGGERAVKEAV